MADWVRVAHVCDIAPGSARAVTAGRYDVAIFNVDGSFYAIENTCPHQGGPLADGYLDGPYVTCPWHAWCFDVRNGKMTLGDFATVLRFETRVENGALFVFSEPLAEL